MTSLLGSTRENLEAQGFCGLDDSTIERVNYPLRLSPAICMTWAAIGTALASPAVLWALVPFALLGALLRSHPFDVIYNHGLRHLTGAPALPPYKVRRRLACAMATVMLVAAAWGFQSGLPLLGQVMGWSLVGAAFVNVTTGFCVPSFIMRLLFGKVVCR